jgi:hypothetical protein
VYGFQVQKSHLSDLKFFCLDTKSRPMRYFASIVLSTVLASPAPISEAEVPLMVNRDTREQPIEEFPFYAADAPMSEEFVNEGSFEMEKTINGQTYRCICQPAGTCECSTACPTCQPVVIMMNPVVACQGNVCTSTTKKPKITQAPKTTTTTTPVPLCAVTAMIPCDSELKKSRLRNHIKIVKKPTEAPTTVRDSWYKRLIFWKKSGTTTTTTPAPASIPGVFYYN